MERSEAKQTWSSPELIVLVRGAPEERVLGACKATPNSGPEDSNTECFNPADSCSECANESFS
jgi:hypothetical protein